MATAPFVAGWGAVAVSIACGHLFRLSVGPALVIMLLLVVLAAAVGGARSPWLGGRQLVVTQALPLGLGAGLALELFSVWFSAESTLSLVGLAKGLGAGLAYGLAATPVVLVSALVAGRRAAV